MREVFIILFTNRVVNALKQVYKHDSYHNDYCTNNYPIF